jgi:hypothetical protein
MELDELKLLVDQEVAGNWKKPALDIIAIIRLQSRGIIQQLLKSIKFEMAMAFLFLLVTVIACFLIPRPFILVVATVTIFYILYFLYYLSRLYHQLKDFGREVLSTRLALQLIYQLMRRYTRLYFLFCSLFLPILLFIAIGSFFWEHPGLSNEPALLLRLRSFRLFIGWYSAWSIFIYFFSRWYIRKVYGQYLQKLKKLILELDAS